MIRKILWSLSLISFWLTIIVVVSSLMLGLNIMFIAYVLAICVIVFAISAMGINILVDLWDMKK